jgi:hypothetical protein
MKKFPLARFVAGLALIMGLAAPAYAQNTLIDLRPADVNSDGEIVYQNFIFSHLFADGKFMVEGLFLRIPGTDDFPDYKEVSAGAGYRVVQKGGLNIYALAHFAKATDVNWFQPAALMTFTSGKWAASAFGQRYVSLTEDYPSAWLVDPAEVQYTVAGPLALGVSGYVFASDDSPALKKIGPKASVADKYGATELRVARSTYDGLSRWEFQLRRIILF